MNIRILAAALAAAFPVAAFAQNAPAAPPVAPTPPVVITTPAAQAVTLRYKFALGQVRRYKMTMTMTGAMLTGQSGAGVPMNTVIEMTMRQTVKDIRPSDGAATIEQQIESMQTSMNGKDVPSSPQQGAILKNPSTSVMLPTGKVVSIQMPAMAANALPGMDFSKALSSANVAFPDLPVKVGDVWNGAVTAGMAGMKMLTTSTLAGVDTSNSGQIATINQKIDGDINMNVSKGMPITMKIAGKMTGDGTQIFDVAAGEIAKQTMTMDINFLMQFTPPAGQTVPAGMPGAMKMAMKETVTMERLSDTAPAVAPAQ